MLTRVTLVGVALECVATLGDLESVLGDNLIEGVGPSREDLASVTVAQNVALLVRVELGSPFGLTAVADSVVASHFDGFVCVV